MKQGLILAGQPRQNQPLAICAGYLPGAAAGRRVTEKSSNSTGNPLPSGAAHIFLARRGREIGQPQHLKFLIVKRILDFDVVALAQ
jgi:hypothetical protein